MSGLKICQFDVIQRTEENMYLRAGAEWAGLTLLRATGCVGSLTLGVAGEAAAAGLTADVGDKM